MCQEVLLHILSLDEEGWVVELVLQQEILTHPHISNALSNMIGNNGICLSPHAEHCPKPMLRVGAQPILEIMFEKCIANGFSRFYFSVNYLEEQIISYFYNGSHQLLA